LKSVRNATENLCEMPQRWSRLRAIIPTPPNGREALGSKAVATCRLGRAGLSPDRAHHKAVGELPGRSLRSR
jgi:hypothetical protein